LFILGLSAFLFGFKVSKDKLEDIVLVLTLSTILSVYFLFQSLVSGTGIGFAEGVLLILIFIWYVNRIYKKNKSKRIHPSPSISRQEGLNAFILFILGIFAVLISSHFVVEFAKILAEKANLATSFIGATIIAMGTSLPEISVVFQAIKKKKYDIGIGNIFGANTVNLTLVLGVASTLTPITVNIVIFSAALLFAIITNSFFLYFSVLKREFTKKTGIFMLLIYLIYLFVIFRLQFSTAQTVSFT
jgi:cation:H+ antiporter